MRLGNADQVDATAELRALMAQQAQAFDLPRLLEAIRLFSGAASESRSSWQPSLPLELALADSIEEKLSVTPPQPPSRPVDSQPEPAGEAKPTSQAHAPAHKPAPPATPGTPTPPPSDPKSAKPEAASKAPPPANSETIDPQGSSPANPAQAAASDQSAVLHNISQNWARVRMAVKKMRPSTEALLNSCKLLGMKNGALLLGFQGEIVKSKMETPENMELTRQAIANVTGLSVALICVVSNKSGTAPADLDIDRDGMVGTALNLGGQIVHKE